MTDPNKDFREAMEELGDMMSNQSPAEGLRQQIMYELDNMNSSDKTDTLDDIMELVTAYAATVEREARIDEMELLDKTIDDNNFDYHWPSEDGEYYDVNKYIADRLAALQGPRGKEQ